MLKHLTSNAARKAFVEADACEHVRHKLRHKIRYNERSYQSGDLVYYKREDSVQWLGPAKVIVQDGKVIFIRHGSYVLHIYLNWGVLKGEEYASVQTPTISVEPVSKATVGSVECDLGHKNYVESVILMRFKRRLLKLICTKKITMTCLCLIPMQLIDRNIMR